VRNPWLKKNPFMSMWLSGANAVAGSAHVHAKRQATTAMTQASNDMVRAWADAFAPARPQPRKRRR